MCVRINMISLWSRWIALFIGGITLGSGQRLDEIMKNDPDISQFYAYMEPSKSANFTLGNKQCTIFAPINAAFQKLGEVKGEIEPLVLYHMLNIPKTTDQLGSSYTSLLTELSGSPPIWITHVTGSYHNDIYVNNARILVSQSNVKSSGTNLLQVLHKIDEVLSPTISPSSVSNRIYNPTAWEFLYSYDSFIENSQTPFRIRNFLQRVQQKGKQDIFKDEGGHTFFIPIDEGFGNDRAASIDEKIIDGHVIPKQVLFTTPTRKDVPYQTLANGDNTIRVVISFTQEKRGSEIVNYVKSHTLFGDGNHTPGVVLAQIVKANIPVKNGVVHLIQKPLMVVDSSVRKLLEEQMDYICNVGNVARHDNIPEYIQDYEPDYYQRFPEFIQQPEQEGRILSNFFKAIQDAGKEGEKLLETLDKGHDVTLFAPCNKAMEGDLILKKLLEDPTKLIDILKMHVIVDSRLYLEKIFQEGQVRPFQFPTLNTGKILYFNVVSSNTNRTLSVEGGGVNATVIQPDLAATNGIIHIIDRVLGVPYNTILDKLRADPMLSLTYELGNLQNFNYQLNNTKKQFTYFVPSNKAWKDAEVDLPSAIKKVFMKEYAFHATATLERHLVVSNESYTMERIKQLSNATNTYGTFGTRRDVNLPTTRGSLALYIEEKKDNTNPESENTSFIIVWKGRKIPVFRPNVECTNGIIHVIDLPMIRDEDIIVASAITFAPQVTIYLIFLLLLI
ncbi:fasciclin-1 isoform X1 [Diorhabda carinulata]|uniref:fasciclin-1 isoform X1 n=1 Tax=Diorhabda carinulata TaxID=1163345 RepID=UPI0025A099DA|nr:fasciclin-1 isoform X1 [Diorhabda carinulata]